MRKITPLIVSGSTALVQEHPDMFKLAPPVSQTNQAEHEFHQAEMENKIPIFDVNEVQFAAQLNKKIDGAHILHIMPPNIEVFRAKLEKQEETSQEKVNRTCEHIKDELTMAYKSHLYTTEDFIIQNNDFEKSYQSFKKRVFDMYKH